MVYCSNTKVILEMPVDNKDGTFTFVDFKGVELTGERPSKPWPKTFEQWQLFIKYVFNRDLPRPE